MSDKSRDRNDSHPQQNETECPNCRHRLAELRMQPGQDENQPERLGGKFDQIVLLAAAGHSVALVTSAAE
ncbi:MAG: hypothetical protein U1G07_25770 [Verrucomicrobiota bacterium]